MIKNPDTKSFNVSCKASPKTTPTAPKDAIIEAVGIP